MTNFLREKWGLHCIGRDRGDKSFDKGGPASHRKVFGLPSVNSRTNVIHQIFIGIGGATGGKDKSFEIGSYAVCGGESKDSPQLISGTPRSRGENHTFDFEILMSWPDSSQKSKSMPPRFL